MFLIDEQLRITGVGLILQKLANHLVSGITEISYIECAAKITAMTGQRIGPMGIWKTIQALGEKVCEEEQALVKVHKTGKVQGKTITQMLFEETDEVYEKLQREQKRGEKIKVDIGYEGWKETGTDRYSLDKKVVVAGFTNSKESQEYREASIAENIIQMK